MAHGTQKLLGFPASDFSPAVGSLPWIAGCLEIGGGLLLLVGLFTRPVAFLLSGQMAVAYWLAHAPQSFFPVAERRRCGGALLLRLPLPGLRRAGRLQPGRRRAEARAARAGRRRPRQGGRETLSLARDPQEEPMPEPAFDVREPAAEAALGALPEWDLSDLYAAPDAPEIGRDLDWLEGRVRGLRRRLRGQARRARRRGPARGDPALREDRDGVRPARQLCRPALLSEHHRSVARQVLRRHADRADRRHDAAGLLHAGAEPARRRGARRHGGVRSGARALQAGARPHPQDEAAPALRRAGEVPARPVGGRRRGLEPALRRDAGGAELRGRRRDAVARGDARSSVGPRPRPAAGRRRGAGGGVQGEPAALRPRHQHAGQGEGDRGPLAQAPRPRRRAGISPTTSSPRWSRRCATRWSRPIRGSRTATMR